MKQAAIDLTWVRHKKVGGTEAYVTNLLDGFAAMPDAGIKLFLLVTMDNREVFAHYGEFPHMELLLCPVCSADKGKRVWWQNIHMGALLKQHGISICVEPVYLMPFLNFQQIRYITTIHDFQASHYPEYFSKARVMWMKVGWKNTVKNTAKLVVTSEYVKNDVLANYPVDSDKVSILYDPVKIDPSELAPAERLADFGAVAGEYYYLVSSLLPHKNIETAIRALGLLKQKNSPAYRPFFISGIGGRDPEVLMRVAREYGIEEDIHITPFISNAERNLLYQNCKAFLFPSLFEGFGLTPLEAMLFGAPVLATKESCTYETTGGLAQYVNNAREPEDWCAAMEKGISAPDPEAVRQLVEHYSPENIAGGFITLINELEVSQ